jgi:hypothetical protein
VYFETNDVVSQTLYERAVTEHCLEAGLWEDYLAYLDFSLRIEAVSLPAYQRAVRNCPWSERIWSGYIRTLGKRIFILKPTLRVVFLQRFFFV